MTMQTGLNIKFSWPMLAIALMAFSSITGRSETTASEQQLRELTQTVDPFNRLSAFPVELRPAEAVAMCVNYIDSIANRETKRLKGIAPASLSEKQEQHLIVSVSLIMKALQSALIIKSSFNPEMPQKTELKLQAIEQAAKSVSDKYGGDLSKPLVPIEISNLAGAIETLAQVK